MNNITCIRSASLLALALAVTACNGGDDDSETDIGTSDGPVTVSGTLSYEAPVPTCDAPDDCWLDYDNADVRPVRHARVALLDLDGDILVEGRSDESGAFALEYDGVEAEGSVFAYADVAHPSGRASITVIDNTNDNAWGGFGPDVDLTADQTVDVLFEHGFNGNEYESRASGPFSAADGILRISEQYLAADETYDLVPLTLFWSPNNVPESGEVSDGNIGTSYYNDDAIAIYLLGAEDIDTDEFDTHILMHEWTHFLQARESRSDSVGGTHSDSDILDPRVAHGEGLATALAALVYSEVPFTDTSGETQVGGYSNNIEEATADVGWWSEAAVQRIVYDLFDSVDDAGDTVSLPLSELWTRLVVDDRVTPAFTTIFSFVDAVKRANTAESGAIDTLTTTHGIDPVADAWGTGETHDAGSSFNLPVYTIATIGGANTVTFEGDVIDNFLGSNRYARFTGTGASMTVDVTSTEDVDISVFAAGVDMGGSAFECDSSPCTETVTLTTVAGAEYIVAITGFGTPNTYTATVEVY